MMKRLPPFLIAAVLAFGLWPSLSPLTRAASVLNQTTDHSNTVLVANRLGRYGFRRFRVRASRYRRNGSARGTCPREDNFVPVVPVIEDSSETTASASDSNNPPVAAYSTASAQPTFFVKFPQMPPTQGTLFVENADASLPRSQRQLYKVEFSLPGSAGIVGIRVPTDAPALQAGTTYLWRLSIYCVAGSTRDVVLLRGGVVERVPSVTGSADQRLAQYIEQEIWQDLLMTIAEDRYAATNRSTIEAEWQNLMTGAGLPEELRNTPIVAILDARLVE